MFLFRGGHQVKKGTYWDLEHDRIILKEDSCLPGTDKETYFRLPESYLLIFVFLLGLALSMALPYGVGTTIFLCLAGLTVVIYRSWQAFFRLFRKK
jgi:hypothetical protein